jgi:hypothetical protein
MQVFQNEIMQVAGFTVTVCDYEDGQPTIWRYGLFDTYDDAFAFTRAYGNSMIEPMYKPVTH